MILFTCPLISHANPCCSRRLGPKVRMLLLDCRTERKLNQIVSKYTYERVFAALRQLPSEVEHLVVLLGVPIAYPRMVFIEGFLTSKFNPITALGRKGVPGFSGLVNKCVCWSCAVAPSIC